MSKKENIETPSEEEIENNQESPEDEENAEEAEILIPISEAEFDRFKKDIEEARKEAEVNRDGMLRAQADYQNLRRRTAVERDQMKVEAIGSVVTPFLDILADI